MTNQAIHELLDISLNTPREVADVFFAINPQCHNGDIRIFTGGWEADSDPDFRAAFYYGEKEEADNITLLENVKEFLSPENAAARKKARNKSRIATLRAQLEAAEKESA